MVPRGGIELPSYPLEMASFFERRFFQCTGQCTGAGYNAALWQAGSKPVVLLLFDDGDQNDRRRHGGPARG